MIRFQLNCDNGHQFESWFKSNATFDSLKQSNMLSCEICGSPSITKSLMAPAVQLTPVTSTEQTPGLPEGSEPNQGAASPQKDQSKPQNRPKTTETDAPSISQMQNILDSNSDYVGDSFAQEARAIHDGASPQRLIHGEAQLSDVKELLNDGIPVCPIPAIPRKKAN